jgi:uncharacterized protein YhaN
MKLTSLQVDGFGIWSGLTLGDLSPGCNVFYGPNEAGKTTLMQFVRAVIYGFSPERRDRYLPPLQGTTWGGTLTVFDGDEGRLAIHRRQSSDPLGSAVVEATDGTTQGEPHLKRLLHGVDEATFNNVFAVGLRELQELATLNDTEAAKWLYSFASGIDRVSLSEVQQSLAHSLAALTGGQESQASSQPSEIASLSQQRKRILHDLEEQSAVRERYLQLASQRRSCEREIDRIEKEIAADSQQHAILRGASSVFDAWKQRAALDARLKALEAYEPWPAGAADKMRHLVKAIRARRQQQKQLLATFRQLGEEAAATNVNPLVFAQRARIEVLAEQEQWAANLEREIAQAAVKSNALSQRQKQIEEQISSFAPEAASGRLLAGDVSWPSLVRAARKVSKARRRWIKARKSTLQSKSEAESRLQSLAGTLKSQSQDNLTSAIEAAGGRVSQLRKAIQLDEQIAKLSKSRAELEPQLGELANEQIFPTWIIIALGCVFVLGIVLLLSGLVLPASFTGSWGWPLAGLGALGTIAAIGGKLAWERSAAMRFDTCQKRLSLVESQAKEARAQRQAIDRAFPQAVVAPAQRLAEAERELASLEKLLPLQAEYETIDANCRRLNDRAKTIRVRYKRARRLWQSALMSAGLTSTLTPKQLRNLIALSRERSTLRPGLAEGEATIAQRHRELQAIVDRVSQIYRTLGIEPVSNAIVEQISQLRTLLTADDSARRRIIEIKRQRSRIRRKATRIDRRLRKLKRRGSALLATCGAKSIKEFRQRWSSLRQYDDLLRRRNEVASAIASQLAGLATEGELSGIIGETSRSDLEAEVAKLDRRRDECRRRQQQMFEERGQLAEQLRLLGADRRWAVKRFELAQIDARLEAAIEKWRALAVTAKFLDRLKDEYQRNRQPETLRQASVFMNRFTQGRCRRIWTPFEGNVLLVDDHQGVALSVDVLSQGTREQLFLSLRLALVGSFARRGVELPMILDDVLVNFDEGRAAAAVDVLRDFAAAGRQLLIFTCHEHIAKLFENRGVEVRRLPAFSAAREHEEIAKETSSEPRRNKRRRVKEIQSTVIEMPPHAPVEPLTTDQFANGSSFASPATEIVHRVDPAHAIVQTSVVDFSTPESRLEEPTSATLENGRPEPALRRKPFHRPPAPNFDASID